MEPASSDDDDDDDDQPHDDHQPRHDHHVSYGASCAQDRLQMNKRIKKLEDEMALMRVNVYLNIFSTIESFSILIPCIHLLGVCMTFLFQWPSTHGLRFYTYPVLTACKSPLVIANSMLVVIF